jgi:hypothetical protein
MLIKRVVLRLYNLLTISFVFSLKRLKLSIIKEDWVSTNPDENIFHVFYDVMVYFSPHYKKIHLVDESIDKESQVQRWRLFLLQKIYPTKTIKYVQSPPKSQSLILRRGYDHTSFVQYPIKNPYRSIVERICSKEKGEYILFNQRAMDDRYLYDSNTGLGLGDFLKTKQFEFPLRVCSFHEMTVEEQYEACSKALLFISAHGAGCTNLIFTPIDCPLIEISQRTHWYCDPVCDDHFFNKTKINDQCQDKLNYRESYHKAEFHNLSYLIGKKYVEINPVKYEGVFTGRNPINKQKIFVDGNLLLNTIEDCLDVK